MNAEVRFTRAVIVRRDRAYIAAFLDALPKDAAHSRLFLHDAARASLWTHHDVPWQIAGLASLHEREGAEPLLCALSKEGDVELAGGGMLRAESIPDAGLHGEASKGYGYLSALAGIGSHLYACGAGGQVYRRREPGVWTHADRGLLQAPDVQDRLLLWAIDGSDENDVYVAGDLADRKGRTGKLFHWNGSYWREVSLPRVDGLNTIYVQDPKHVWIAGPSGALLMGNHKAGFISLSTHASSQVFYDLTVYAGTLYLGSNHGLFRYDEGRRRVVRARTDLSPELSRIHTVDHADGMLWCVGPKDITRFDGTTWERVHHPDNHAGST